MGVHRVVYLILHLQEKRRGSGAERVLPWFMPSVSRLRKKSRKRAGKHEEKVIMTHGAERPVWQKNKKNERSS